MKINLKTNNPQKINKISFKSGISPKNIETFKNYSSLYTQKYFAQNLGIDAYFTQNKMLGFLNYLSSNVLDRLGGSKKLNFLNFLSKPSSIRVYNKIELNGSYPNYFCTFFPHKIIKNEGIKRQKSLFFINDNLTYKQYNTVANYCKRANITSSSNILNSVMHEWMHQVHADYLYSRNLNSKSRVLSNIKKIKKVQFTPFEKEIIRKYLGEYVYNKGNINPMEVVAEGLNYLVCNCLDRNEFKIISSIDDQIDKAPKKLIEIIEKCFI